MKKRRVREQRFFMSDFLRSKYGDGFIKNLQELKARLPIQKQEKKK